MTNHYLLPSFPHAFFSFLPSFFLSYHHTASSKAWADAVIPGGLVEISATLAFIHFLNTSGGHRELNTKF